MNLANLPIDLFVSPIAFIDDFKSVVIAGTLIKAARSALAEE